MNNLVIYSKFSGSMDKHCAPVWGIKWKEPQVVHSSGSSRKESGSGSSFKDAVMSLKKVS